MIKKTIDYTLVWTHVPEVNASSMTASTWSCIAFPTQQVCRNINDSPSSFKRRFINCLLSVIPSFCIVSYSAIRGKRKWSSLHKTWQYVGRTLRYYIRSQANQLRLISLNSLIACFQLHSHIRYYILHVFQTENMELNAQKYERLYITIKFKKRDKTV